MWCWVGFSFSQGLCMAGHYPILVPGVWWPLRWLARQHLDQPRLTTGGKFGWWRWNIWPRCGVQYEFGHENVGCRSGELLWWYLMFIAWQIHVFPWTSFEKHSRKLRSCWALVTASRPLLLYHPCSTVSMSCFHHYNLHGLIPGKYFIRALIGNSACSHFILTLIHKASSGSSSQWT